MRFSSAFQGSLLIPHFAPIVRVLNSERRFLRADSPLPRNPFCRKSGKACNSKGAGRGVQLSSVVVAVGLTPPHPPPPAVKPASQNNDAGKFKLCSARPRASPVPFRTLTPQRGGRPRPQPAAPWPAAAASRGRPAHHAPPHRPRPAALSALPTMEERVTRRRAGRLSPARRARRRPAAARRCQAPARLPPGAREAPAAAAAACPARGAARAGGGDGTEPPDGAGGGGLGGGGGGGGRHR